jgi:hypothetical protein
VADGLRGWVEAHGIPRALYVDWKSVYLSHPTERQKREGITPISQFGRMCAKLGIELIGANSAQAKGRVERGHGTHQDRLIKKMRLKGISSYDAANDYLRSRYWSEHNGRYAVEPRERADYHLPIPKGMDLDQVFCLEEERKVSRDWVVQYGRRWLQIEKSGQKALVRSGDRVVIREHRDGSLTLLRNETKLRWHELVERPRKPAPLPKPRRVARTTPAPDHPWRRLRFAAAKP